jgi:hypothetical protein
MSSEPTNHGETLMAMNADKSVPEARAVIESADRPATIGSEVCNPLGDGLVSGAGNNASNETSIAADDLAVHAILIKNLEQEARNDLMASLRRKGLPEEAANHYKITISVSKPRSRDNKKKAELSSSTFYTAPNGSLFVSKTDVINDIQNNRFASDFSQLRVQAHEAAKLDLEGITLPANFGRIKVLSWGDIDRRIGFQSPSQLWPVGYRCQQTIEGSTLNGIKKLDIICQIGVSDAGFPQFHIYNPSNDGTFIASSEANVWRKFNPHNVDNNWNPSFFNFDIELLLEGLPNALDCDEYKFHCERGYGKSYFTEEEAIAAKNVFLAKQNREKRTLDRQKRQSMSAEEIARNAALQKLKEAEEIELAKASSAKSKEVREAEKEERRRAEAERKERQKEEDRIRRERIREEEKLNKDSLREEERLEKERLKELERSEKERLKENGKLEREKIRELERLEREKLKELERIEKEKAKEFEKLERERVREAERLEKERIKETERLNREKQKEAERLQKEKIREAERLEKERLKQFDKQRIIIRKELNTEVRKLRTDLSTLILQNFDREEEIEEGALPAEFAGIDLQSNDIADDVTVPQILERSGSILLPSMLGDEKQEIWDRFFYVLSGVNLMRQHVGIDKRYSLDDFNKIIVRSLRDAESKVPDSYFESQLDRIELNLIKLLLPDLHTFLELDEREGDSSRRKDKRQGACSFPLNQLTWTELARMVLLNYILSGIGRTKEDRQHGIRGSKLPNFRLAKNVIRNIRYQWYLRTSLTDSSITIGDQNTAVKYAPHFDHLAAIQWCNNKIEISCKEYKEAKPYPIIFDSEQEMEQKLKESVQSDVYPEVYKRCCLIILRVLELRSVENFMWEVDKEAFPDYYTTIRRPIYLSSIASNLVEKGYGYEADRPELVADSVFAELKQMYVNCVTYNTEYQTIVAQAAKMYMFTHHLFLRWIYDPDRPSLEQCTENYCLLSGVALVNSSKTATIRCGKCQHSFHFPTLEEILQESPSAPTNATVRRLRPYILEPTPEMYTSINEEWHCPFCLQEDSSICRKKFAEAGIPLTENEYFVNEWGFSSCLPWIFSEKYSCLMDYIRQHEPYLEVSVEALKVLSSPNKTSFHQSGEYMVWTPAERITVLSALFEVMQSTPKAVNRLKRIHDDCANIMRMCAKTSFREADFMTSVRDLSGEEAMKCCRILLDGLDSGNTTEPYLQSFLTEGRCMVCNTSTYEEDEDEDQENGDTNATPPENPVILCDGCNAEAHLNCLGLAAVPNDAWYCSVCVDRQARRDRISTTVENVEQWRDKEEEDRLLNEYVNSKIPELCRSTGEYSSTQCSYCGMTELEICSPFVIGQNRAEHDDWVAAITRVPIAANFLFPQSNCNVNFLHGGNSLSLPKISCPSFPIENSEEGKKLLEMYEAVDRKPVIVHQLCALQMFQARSNRSRHLLRRRRNIVGEKALSMSGISQQPLGYDIYHNEYWKFPFCSDLFVKVSGLTDPSQSNRAFSEDQRDFYKMIGHNSVDSSASTATNFHWIRIQDLDVIKSITSLLGNSLSEQQLRLNLIKEVIVDKTLQMKDITLAVTSNVSANQTSLTSAVSTTNLSTQDLATNATDDNGHTNMSKKGYVEGLDANTPVALKLYLTKGVEVPSSVMIQEEAAFVDSDNAEDTNDEENPEEEDEGLNHLSFNTKSKKYFAVGMVNSSGGLVKTANLPQYGNYTIVYQIHREGYSQPVATASLSEPWTDHMYYFCTLLFKKSGNYTVSFLVEGTNKAGSIRPLVFPVAVHASSVRCGLPDALHRLQASQYIDNAQRQIVLHRRELLVLTQRPLTDFAAVKAALVSLYLALPLGALSDNENSTTASSSSGRGGAASSGNKTDTVTPPVQLLEPNGWNAALETAWKNAIVDAQSVWEVMECVLVLEFYLNRTWLAPPNSRLLSALPSAHFAMRAVTLSSIALRIYSIDKALAYEKVQVAPRELRTSNANGTGASTSTSMAVDEDGYHGNSYARNHGSSSAKKDRAARYLNRSAALDVTSSPPVQAVTDNGRNRRSTAIKRINYHEEDEGNNANGDDDNRQSNKRRASAMDVDEGEENEDEDAESYGNGSDEDEDEDDEGQGSNDDGDVEVTTSAAPTVWLCSACGTENSARARSCDVCQTRKPAMTTSTSNNRHPRTKIGAGQKRTRVDRRTAPARKRVRRSSSSTGYRGSRFDEEEVDEEEESEEEEEKGEVEQPLSQSESRSAERPHRSSLATTTVAGKKYNFDDESNEDEAEFDAPVSRRSSSTPAKSKKKTPEEIEFEMYVHCLPGKIETLSQQIKDFHAEETDGDVDLFVRAMSLLRMLLEDVRSQAFWEPVDLASVASYSNYVKEPMDLGTILSRLRFRAYSDEELPTVFEREVRLVFQNCQAYNMPGSLLFDYSVE